MVDIVFDIVPGNLNKLTEQMQQFDNLIQFIRFDNILIEFKRSSNCH